MQYILTSGVASVTAGSGSTATNDVALTGTSPTVLDATGTVTNTARAALEAQWKQIGLRVYMDDGRGYAVEVNQSLLGADLRIIESIEGWADELQFSLVGEQWSPWLSAAIRGRYAVRVDVSYGSPGNHHYATVFDGFLHSGSFSAYPPVAKVRCLDSAILYSEAPVHYSLAAQAGKTRLEILHELIAGIPVGNIDLGGDGGIVKKSLSTGPEAKLFDVIREVICGPTGAHLFFAAGRLNIARYGTAQNSATLRRGTISSMQVDVPATTDANTVAVVSVQFNPDKVATSRTETQIEEVRQVYAPQAATAVQNADGSVTEYGSAQPTPVEMVTRRIITTSTYTGSVLTFQQVDEYAWFAPVSATSKTVHPADIPVEDVQLQPIGLFIYRYPDGTWHRERYERFRLVRRTISHKETNADGFVTTATENRYFFQSLATAVYLLITNTAAPSVPPLLAQSSSDVPVDEQGNGMQFGEQVMGGTTTPLDTVLGAGIYLPSSPDSSTTTTWTLEADGTIRNIRTVEQSWGPARTRLPGPGAFRRGLTSDVYYDVNGGPAFDVYNGNSTVRTVVYTQAGEEAYAITDTVDDGHGSPVRTSSAGTGQRPRAEQVQPETHSQEVRSTIEDGLRVTLNGAVVTAIHNEYCETPEEVRLFAATELRRLSSWVVPISMPIEGLIHKGASIRLEGLDEIGAGNVALDVVGVERDFGAYRQVLHCLYRPPEVATL